MSGAQSYIVRLLRKVEMSLLNDRHQIEGAMMGKIIDKFSHSDDVEDALESLFSVKGFDEFALRLMWSLEKRGKEVNGLDGRLIDYEVESLSSLLKRPTTGGELSSPKEAVELQSVHALDGFYEALHKFGRVIEETRRNLYDGESFKGINQDSLFRILHATGSLEEAATSARKDDVVMFTKTLAQFVQYVMDHGLFKDVRIMNIVDNANLTLQTVMEAAGTENRDSLQQTIALLGHPRELLD